MVWEGRLRNPESERKLGVSISVNARWNTLQPKDISRELAAAALDRIEASKTFDRAQRSLQFLRYVVEERLAGRAGEIKEYSIAHSVYGRTDYDPRVDSLVRVEASKLRQKLEQYYAEEGKEERVRFELPKGLYVPEIQIEAPPAQERRRFVVWGLGGIALSGAIWGLAARSRTPSQLSAGPVGIAIRVRALAAPLSGMAARLETELSGALSGIQRIRVLGLNAAEAILDIGLEEHPEGLRAVAQLQQSRDGYRLWSEAFDGIAREGTKELVGAVVFAFRYDLPGCLRAMRERGTSNTDAWHYYVRGNVHFDRGEAAEAGEMFQAAIAADGNYALAHAGYARSLILQRDWFDSGPESLEPARRAARQAERLDGRAVLVQQAAGTVRAFLDHDWAGAETAFRKAIAGDPTEIDARYDLARLVLSPTGRHQEAEQELRAAIAMNPEHNLLWNALAQVCLRRGNARAALEAGDRALALTPQSPAAHGIRGMALLELGQNRDAIGEFQRMKSDWGHGLMGVGLARAGQMAEAARMLDLVKDRCRKAWILVALGQRKEALEQLEGAASDGALMVHWIAVDIYLRGLRGEPQFQQLCRRMGLDLQPDGRVKVLETNRATFVAGVVSQ